MGFRLLPGKPELFHGTDKSRPYFGLELSELGSIIS